MPSDNSAPRINDILENINWIELYIADMELTAFMNDQRTVDAVERCLLRIAEAVTRLGKRPEVLVPDYPWRDVRGYGNFVRHEYDRVRKDDTWVIATHDLPLLKTAVLRLAEVLKPDAG